MIKHYFGTDLDCAGHYLWSINLIGTRLAGSAFSFSALPFSPEYITENLSFGEINWQHHKSPIGEFTVCAIAGSPFDARLGTKSVFIHPAIIPFEEMKELIFATPICKQIIEKMPFQVKW